MPTRPRPNTSHRTPDVGASRAAGSSVCTRGRRGGAARPAAELKSLTERRANSTSPMPSEHLAKHGSARPGSSCRRHRMEPNVRFEDHPFGAPADEVGRELPHLPANRPRSPSHAGNLGLLPVGAIVAHSPVTVIHSPGECRGCVDGRPRLQVFLPARLDPRAKAGPEEANESSGGADWSGFEPSTATLTRFARRLVDFGEGAPRRTSPACGAGRDSWCRCAKLREQCL
jgi:hypothetical protein